MPGSGEELLSLATLPSLPGELRPGLDPRGLSVGIVHLGLGAFHRAHQVVYTEAAALAAGEERWGICGVSERSPAAAELLSAQDGLYSVRLAAPSGSSLQVLASLRAALFAGSDVEALLARIADPSVSLVTLTVTEKGYRHDPHSGRLRRDDPEIAADASGRPPVTVVGQLVRGLEARRRAGSGPITILSCDNLPANGRLLAGLVGELCELPGAVEGGFREWLAEEVSFPCSMVDRIVPASTPADRAEAARLLGVEDRAAIACEPFTQWVLEDRFFGPRPAWERAGAQLVGEVEPYETLKLRVLNGSHSALAYLGALAGMESIAEAAGQPALAGFVRGLVDEEVAPTLALPPGVELPAYRDEVLERFSNPFLGHRTLQVGSDGSQKLPQRILGTVRDRLAAGAEPRRCALVVAAYVRAVCEGRDEQGRPLEVVDPLADRLRELVRGESVPSRVAERVLGLREVFGDDLPEDGRFARLLAEALGALAGGEVLAVASAYAGPGEER